MIKAIKRYMKVPARFTLLAFSAILSPIFALIARTGIGSNVCMKFGFLPIPLHYYQPIFDPDDLKEELWQKAHQMPGIDLDIEEQLKFLKELGHSFGKECSWLESPSTDSRQSYYSLNSSFGFSSACLLHSVVRRSKPSKVIEVGAGMSTLITAGALGLNKKESEVDCEFVSIDPYPKSYIHQGIPQLARVVQKPVQDVSPKEFSTLSEGDILFIDSSHVVRTGGGC